jgi:dTDP-4-dehydrorhamnose reductase
MVGMSKLKVAVLGCGGVIGQHMMISVPENIEPLFVRKHPFPLSHALDLEDWTATKAWLDEHQPAVIVNLAGESRPDVVERDHEQYGWINNGLASELAEWCDGAKSHLVHVSTQAVFSGKDAPYQPGMVLDPVNWYGNQKQCAEISIAECAENWTIVRPTFVLGIRPFQALGRENPAEAILSGAQRWQVDNRWFSISFAWDVAEMLWKMATLQPKGKIVHCGNPERLSRYELAKLLNPDGQFEAITHEHLQTGMPLAERPLDTTYRDAYFETPLKEGLRLLRLYYQWRAEDTLQHRAMELAAFLREPWVDCHSELGQGFGPLHNAVSDDFRNAVEVHEKTLEGWIDPPLRQSPANEDELLAWYRGTEAYLWELTAYHCDAGFAYDKTCEGIITHLTTDWMGRVEAVKAKYRVLCLGDGVGTLAIKMKEAGFDAAYHDLFASRTSAFALTRFAMRFTDPITERMSSTFEPPIIDGYDAVVSLDYLEHVPNVKEWVLVIFAALKPGGLFCAQNAFAIGSGPEGDMPMHLACNDRFEKDWDPLLAKIGFVQESPQWYRKPQ